MERRLFLYKKLERLGTKGSLLSFYQALISSDENGLTGFIKNCKELAKFIVENGCSVPLTTFALRLRKTMSLPTPDFDEVDIKKIAEVSGLSTIINKGRESR